MVRTYSPTVDIVKQTVSAQNVSVAQTPVERVEIVNADSATTVNSGSTETVTVSPPTSYLYEVLALHLEASPPSGATSGTHFLQVKSSVITFLLGKSTYGSSIKYFYNYWETADSSSKPTAEISQVLSGRGLRLNPDMALSIKYSNDTDANQTGKRTIRVVVRKIKVA